MEVGPRNVSSPHQPFQPSHFEMAGLDLLTPLSKAARANAGRLFFLGPQKMGSGPQDQTPQLPASRDEVGTRRPRRSGGPDPILWGAGVGSSRTGREKQVDSTELQTFKNALNL
jgi:hypothetical protein